MAPRTSADASRTQARRIALVISELSPGGAERVVVHLASTLLALSVEPTVICLQGKGNLAADLERQGLRVVALDSRRGYDVCALWRLARVLRRFRPDVINVHDRSSLPYVAIANRWAGCRPIVLSCHGLLLQALGGPRRRDRFAIKRVAAVTAVSAQTAQEYARFLEWPGKVDVIPNGVPVIDRDPALGDRIRHELGFSADTFVFLAAGNIKPEKGFEDLLEACATLRNRRPAGRFIALVAGTRSDEVYAQRLDSALAERRLSDTVRFLGLRSDTQALYSAADAFVLSSRKEGLPMVLLEAMIAGLPIVATRVGGVPEALQGGAAGLLVDPASPDALAEAMGRMMDDTALRPRLGTAARQSAKEDFSVERMARAYLDVYTMAADTHRAPVVMLSPLPPLRGGMATVADNLRHSHLADRCRLATLNNGKMTAEGRSFLAGAWAQVRLLGRVLDTVRRTRARIVHIHTCALFTFWRDTIHMLALRAMGRRVIYHIHDGTFEAFLRDQPPVRKAILRRSLRMVSRVILLSETARASLEPLARGVAWRVVHNGVAIPPTTGGSRDGAVRFLFLGNLTRRKGAYDLLAATVRAREAGLKAEVRLAGGEVQPGTRQALQQAIADAGCEDQVKVLGYLDGPAKDEALLASDCLVLPSYAEGLPMVVLEAMAYGLPVIATRIGAVPEAVTDGQEGFLIEVGDVEALADRMFRIAADADLRRRMGAAARRRAEAEFSLDTMADRVLAIYSEVLSK
jgi:glycosyltransferase involved in cell wall biosynthesis